MKQAMLLLGMALIISGCGSGGSASNPGAQQVSGLDIPASFSLLTPKGAGNGPTGAGTRYAQAVGGRTALAFDDPQTDYMTDVAHINVHDDSMGALQTVNQILCYMSQTGSSAMVNKGPYVALINGGRCEQGQNTSTAAQTGESSGQTTNFARWVIDSARADNLSPQIVRIWMPNPDQGGGGGGSSDKPDILVQVTITDGVSASHPFGQFRLDFKGVTDGANVGLTAGTEVATMQGMLETVENTAGVPQFRFVDLEGQALNPDLQANSSSDSSANVRLTDADGTGGLALTHTSYTNSDGGQVHTETQTYAVTYDSAHFLSARDDDGDQVADAQVCRSRDQYDTHVWRYALYHHDDGVFRGTAITAGQRVALNSGFPFSYDSDADGTVDRYGWIGSQGIWMESGDTAADGQTIQRFDYNSNDTVPYTVHVSPGKLMRRTSSQAPLSDFVGAQFYFWGQHPVLGMYRQWAVTVDANLNFQLISTVDNGPTGPVFSDTIDDDGDPNTPPVSVAATMPLVNNQTLWLWSDALGGQVSYLHDQAVAPDARQVTYFAQTNAGPDDAQLFPDGTTSLSVYCYDRCLKGGLTQEDVNAAGGMETSLYHAYAGAPITYTLSSANGKVVLTDDANGLVVSAVGLTLDSVGHSWGIGTGEMLLTPLSDPSQPWLVNAQLVTYHWETGANAWNQFVTVADSMGVAASFDQPLQMAYVHSAANDANADATYEGKRFLLEYRGSGDLGGIPSTQDSSGRWNPDLNLADGVVLSTATDSFLVRGLEMEQSMKVVDPSTCAGLNAAAAYTDSGLALPTHADIGDVSFTLAQRPDVTDAPAVIDGQVQ